MWTRRRFAFWLGLSTFWIARRLRADVVDSLAAQLMNATDDVADEELITERDRFMIVDGDDRWSAAENNDWRWFQRETRTDGEWRRTGITTPISKSTGEPYTGQQGYLSEELVPKELRFFRDRIDGDPSRFAPDGPNDGDPDAERRARDGRPPSKWLRSLNADELRIWLKTIHVPYVGVGGMTFRVHLTRDHSFDEAKIKGLTIPEQAKLHSAAHYGY